MTSTAYEGPPGFVAACLAASGAHIAASFLLAIVSVPLALATSNVIVFSGGGDEVDARVLLPWLLVFATQPFIAAWIAKLALELFGAGFVGYRRALGAMVLGLVVTLASAFVLPTVAALPVLGYAWTGAIAAALILAGGRARTI